MSLFIATPMYGGKCDAEYMLSMMQLRDALFDSGVPHEFQVMTNESLITRARNVIARDFLTNEKYSRLEALLFIDADIEFSPDDVTRLWNLEKQVAGGCYSRKLPGEVPKVWVDGVEHRLSDFGGPIQCDRLGTGFMMIRRPAFLKLIGEGTVDYDESGQCWEFFNTPIKDWRRPSESYRDRWMPSEDYFFCDRWREAGGEIWTDPSIHLRHWGRMAF